MGATPTAPPGLLATTGRAPALQAGGYGFESRTVHGCSRKRCSYIAARCPPGLPGLTDRWLSWLERLVYTQKVIGSSPVRSTGGVASELCHSPRFPWRRERINHTVSPSFGAGWREAHLAELADALDLGSSAFGRVGSSPTMRTILTEDPPKPGSVRLPGHQGILLLQWFWTLAWGELNDVSTHPRVPPHNGEGLRPSFLFSGWGPFVMPGVFPVIKRQWRSVAL